MLEIILKFALINSPIFPVIFPEAMLLVIQILALVVISLGNAIVKSPFSVSTSLSFNKRTLIAREIVPNINSFIIK
jgi:hypothetical protein